MEWERVDSFKLSWGIQQGDPLSSYTFVLCVEVLSHQINDAVANGMWKGILFSRMGPMLSHLCFVDDLLLFGVASDSQVWVMQGILRDFCETSCQKVNMSKSQLFFSSNVIPEKLVPVYQ